ncbi:MAG: winged helix-turn-helix transcriptional regulator [Candidatus Heimdallarchaeota archaeon]|nr:MAG: winged helix-turn-helix transcriptional regulator [Candidatus Heimdallarchaeota archaeon]
MVKTNLHKGSIITMTLDDFSPLFEALNSERRRELFQFISTNFVSKNDLAIKFNLKRASLNHHLSRMINAGLIQEVSLLFDGRRHTFIIPIVKIFPERLVEVQQDKQKIVDQLRIWSDRNVTLDNWNILRKSLDNLAVPEDLVESIEIRFFPLIGTRASIETNFCFVCRTNKAQQDCFACKNLVCNVHSYEIDREELGTINLCPNCVKKFFG